MYQIPITGVGIAKWRISDPHDSSERRVVKSTDPERLDRQEFTGVPFALLAPTEMANTRLHIFQWNLLLQLLWRLICRRENRQLQCYQLDSINDGRSNHLGLKRT